MAYEGLLLTENEGVFTLTFNRPSVLNAFDSKTLGELMQALDYVSESPDLRVLVLTGAGRAFCAGAQLEAGGSATAGSSGGRKDMGGGLEAYYNPIIERLRRVPAPVICAVNGAAAGGGCALGLIGDFVIAAKSAYFLQPFANIGLVPDCGATWLLPRLVGRARATAMMMLGERVPAQQAYEWGMIYQVADDEALGAAVQNLAERLVKGPTVSYRLMRQAIWDGLETTLTETMAQERYNQRAAGRTQDHEEGVRAFVEKRPPVFTGR
ncbi:MAG: enoyl-CoA hydratase/isomerase family protein [Caulobacteraceae bacterium]|nr:enoyl-CoA hydratase/isomerase family protein [Caulobacteraceae bacterium]